ncbi:MAG: aldolase [Devosia sp.]|nr:aldolase [Devosia sp.]
MSPPPDRTNVHGTGVVIGGVGVLLRGPSGAGKSLLALELLERQTLLGKPGSLVADDRIDLAPERGRLVMHAPANIAGLIELRGRGIVQRPFVAKAPLHLVVDLVEELVRMVEEDALETDIGGVRLARCPVPRRGVVDAPHQLLLVGEALAQLQSAGPAKRQKIT